MRFLPLIVWWLGALQLAMATQLLSGVRAHHRRPAGGGATDRRGSRLLPQSDPMKALLTPTCFRSAGPLVNRSECGSRQWRWLLPSNSAASMRNARRGCNSSSMQGGHHETQGLVGSPGSDAGIGIGGSGSTVLGVCHGRHRGTRVAEDGLRLCFVPGRYLRDYRRCVDGFGRHGAAGEWPPAQRNASVEGS